MPVIRRRQEARRRSRRAPWALFSGLDIRASAVIAVMPELERTPRPCGMGMSSGRKPGRPRVIDESVRIVEPPPRRRRRFEVKVAKPDKAQGRRFTISICLTAAELAQIDAGAERAQMSRSDWLRKASEYFAAKLESKEPGSKL